MPAHVLIIGIDAASPDLLKRWAGEGKLPAIQRLLERGTTGPVDSPKGFFIGSTWPTFYTGLGPAGHGFHYLVQLRPGSYEFYRPMETPGAVTGTPFWNVASEAGRRVAVLDVPLSRLEPQLNGIQTVEWGGHDAVFGFQASSPEVAAIIASTVGPYPLPTECDANRQTIADYEHFVSGLEDAVARRARLTLDFLRQEHWDLFVQVFTESHCAGHQCWHLHDSSHPSYDEQIRSAIGDPLERVYRAIDQAVQSLLDQAGDATVLLVTAHGMGPRRGAQFLLPEILVRLGVMAKAPAGPTSPPSLVGHVMELGGSVWRALPAPLRDSLRPLRDRLGPKDREGTLGPSLGADTSRSQCFIVPNGLPTGGIRLNIAGREPRGVLAPGTECDAFIAELERDLLAITDARTGQSLISAIHRTDDLCRGALRHALPDLVVEWSASIPTGSLALAGGRAAMIEAYSDKIGTVTGYNDYGRSGEHLPTGMFVASGPAVIPGLQRGPVALADFYPTILELLGLADPQLDGHVIPEIVANRQRTPRD